MKCINCSKKASTGSVYCKQCASKAKTASDPAPKGTFKKTVTSSKNRVLSVNN